MSSMERLSIGTDKMAVIDVYNMQKEKISQVELREDIFQTPIKKHILHDVVVAQLQKRRSGNASTKTRSEVKASGTKLYRQKGTGRARAGTAAWSGSKCPPRTRPGPGPTSRSRSRLRQPAGGAGCRRSTAAPTGAARVPCNLGLVSCIGTVIHPFRQGAMVVGWSAGREGFPSKPRSSAP